jgi:predicted Fe-Mo cluster-binding NifX family protein
VKIAVSSMGTDVEAQVDQRFGRAEGFVIVDSESGEVSHVPNTQNLEAVQGAGIQAAKLVADNGAQVAISGHCGPKAFRTLEAAGIQVIVGVTGTVKDVVAKFKAGELTASSSADVEGHWA